MRTLGKRVIRKDSGVRIPPSPPGLFRIGRPECLGIRSDPCGMIDNKTTLRGVVLL